MHKYRLFGFFVLLALLAGCSHQNPIVGTWSGTQNFPNGRVINSTWTFTADGKNNTSITATNGPYPAADYPLSSTGTYTADNGTMTQTILTMSEPGRTKTITNPVASTYSYTLNGDTLTITIPGAPAPLVLTRQGSS